MTLPFAPPLEPMLAKLSDALPEGDGWLYEPKWDGFRALVFKDGDDVELWSRDKKPLARYFPEVVAALRGRLDGGTLRPQVPARCVLDGEIVIARGGALDFEALLLRIHPAASRVALLSEETPASYVSWDLLALDDDDLRGRPLVERREKLERALGHAAPPVYVAPSSRDIETARDWFSRFEGAGLDGVVSKRLDGPYVEGKRVMVKTKHVRSADCVVAGFRWFKGGAGELVGSLLLGLYDDDGVLHHAGVTSAFTRDKRKELAALLTPLREGAKESHPWARWSRAPDDGTARRAPGVTSRWNPGKSLGFELVRLERVCEVKYDHLQGDRFRHATHFLRWRPDKKPEDCRYDQLEVTPPQELAAIFSSRAD